jgi:hypothetical protein
MGNNYGPGTSRVLSPIARQFLDVIWQQGKPPLDAELNLLQDLASNWQQILVSRGTPSGWLGNETNNSAALITNPTWSNWWRFGRQRTGESQAVEWAVVNGWLIPVTGTLTGTPPGSPDNVDTYNVVAMNPPPNNAGDTRIDFVFLEAWLARVPPNPSSLNKPSVSAIYTYGNVLGGMSYLADDIQDPSIGFETTERVQLQYRIRVVPGIVGLSTNPDGFDPTTVFGQGTSASPTTYTFSNMRSALGDPGLWRAGDGNTSNTLATVDGYTYAIPLSAVFRRNASAWNGDPSQNLNGGFNRNPLAVDATGFKTFSTVPQIASTLSATSTSATLVSATNIPLPATPSTPVLIKIGDEYMTYSAITGTTLGGLTRGVNGSRAEQHVANSTITVISGRPDGLFSDQIARTDLLDLRHVVNPNGFDYESVLAQGLDRLLRGNLQGTWKRSGAGPQGPFVNYQDKISSSSASLGINKLDAPDNIRMIFSDAATMQKVEMVIDPTSATPPASVADATYSLTIAANQTFRGVGNTASTFGPNDIIVFPVSSLKTGVSGGDADQIRWVFDSLHTAVTLRIDGQTAPIPNTLYTVVGSSSVGGATPSSPGVSNVTNNSGLIEITTSFPHGLVTNQIVKITGVVGVSAANAIWTVTVIDPTHFTLNGSSFSGAYTSGGYIQGPNLTPNDDLWVIFAAGFPATSNNIYVTLNVMYGAGRGLARRPTSVQNITFTTPSTELLLNPVGAPASNIPVNTSWVLLWSKYRNTPYRMNLPVTTSTYADLGSKSVVIQPFRQIIWPATATTIDGTAANVSTQAAVVTSSTGATSGGTTFTDSSAPFTSGMVGYALQLGSGPQPGRYTIKAYSSSTSVTLDRPVATGSGLIYTVNVAQGLMPLKAQDGVTPKWTTTDPLQIFSGNTDNPNTRNVYITLPRSFVPNWGEVDVPILHGDNSTFNEGINFMLLSNKGATPPVGSSNYVSYASLGGLTWAVFSTTNYATPTPGPATYNTKYLVGGLEFAGMQFFSDTRNLGRQGLQLPPFYGIARLFAVYEAGDYKLNGSAYNGPDRTARGAGATNLLRQDNSTATFWIEIDQDGDSTFILNANSIDITRSTVNPIANFAAGNYIIEASVFGFDRSAFDISQECRIVLSRNRTQAINAGSDNSANINLPIAGPTSVLPGPATATDSMLVNYSRTPYQGDPWGSQTNYIDVQQALGPLQTATAYQLDSTELTQSALTRPNQKALQVLASVGFATTLGTGRYAGDSPIGANQRLQTGSLPMDFRNVGIENFLQYPPTSSTQPRPNVLTGFIPSPPEVATDYLGATERLPLGALFRDKDFRGEPLTNLSALNVFPDIGEGVLFSNLTSSTVYEQTAAVLDTATSATGNAGAVIAQVDGEPTNYSLLVNYRVNRGGSAFTVSGPNPGGEVGTLHPVVISPSGTTNVLQGRAYLVRNMPTSVGAQEVSAGNELMMLVVTTVQRLTDSNPHAGIVQISTNGSLEGYSAADLYRLDGHPITNDNVRLDTNPATITLSQRAV